MAVEDLAAEHQGRRGWGQQDHSIARGETILKTRQRKVAIRQTIGGDWKGTGVDKEIRRVLLSEQVLLEGGQVQGDHCGVQETGGVIQSQGGDVQAAAVELRAAGRVRSKLPAVLQDVVDGDQVRLVETEDCQRSVVEEQLRAAIEVN